MSNLLLTFFLLFLAFSSFETKIGHYQREYYQRRPCSPGNLTGFHNDNGRLIEKFYNQNSNGSQSGLIDEFNYHGTYDPAGSL